MTDWRFVASVFVEMVQALQLVIQMAGLVAGVTACLFGQKLGWP